MKYEIKKVKEALLLTFNILSSDATMLRTKGILHLCTFLIFPVLHSQKMTKNVTVLNRARQRKLSTQISTSAMR